MNHADWMRQAIEQARTGIDAGQSPFGAVIVKGSDIVARAHNEVWKLGDPTAHAEVLAIRRAAAALRSIDLSGCRIYSTCEPCPMCAAAIHWSRLNSLYYGADIGDAQRCGFTELTLPARQLFERGGSAVRSQGGVMRSECAALFDEWTNADKGRTY